jgi:hypothetical protein
MQCFLWGMSWILIYKIGNVNSNQFCKICHGCGIVCSLCIVALQITTSSAFVVTMSLASIRSTQIFHVNVWIVCRIVTKFWFCWWILIKAPHYKISWKFVQWETGWYMWTDMMKLWGAFRKYVKILGVRFTVKLSFLVCSILYYDVLAYMCITSMLLVFLCAHDSTVEPI